MSDIITSKPNKEIPVPETKGGRNGVTAAIEKLRPGECIDITGASGSVISGAAAQLFGRGGYATRKLGPDSYRVWRRADNGALSRDVYAAGQEALAALHGLEEAGLLRSLEDMDRQTMEGGDTPIVAPYIEAARAALAKAGLL